MARSRRPIIRRVLQYKSRVADDRRPTRDRSRRLVRDGVAGFGLRSRVASVRPSITFAQHVSGLHRSLQRQWSRHNIRDAARQLFQLSSTPYDDRAHQAPDSDWLPGTLEVPDQSYFYPLLNERFNRDTNFRSCLTDFRAFRSVCLTLSS